MPNTWFDSSLNPVIEFEVMPYKYEAVAVNGVTTYKKTYCSISDFKTAITNTAPANYIPDGLTMNGTSNLLTYTF